MQRIAGIAALAVCGLVGVATLAHVAFVVAVITSGRVAAMTLEVRDGVVIYSGQAASHAVAPEAVVAALLTDVTILVVVSLVAVLGVALARDRAFGPRTPAAVVGVGAVIAVGGTASALVASFVDRRHAALTEQLLGGALPPGPLELPFGFLTVSLLPLVAGVMVMLLSFAFRQGVRMQRDTEGLV